MKYKWYARVFGVFETALSSALVSPYIYLAISSDEPIHRITAGVVAGLTAIPSTLLFIDGVTDMIKGTHHYFGLQLWKQYAKITKNMKKVEELDSAIDFYLEYREKDHPFFRRKQE